VCVPLIWCLLLLFSFWSVYASPSFTFTDPLLEIPHPRWSHRGFVMLPLLDLIPQLEHTCSSDADDTAMRKLLETAIQRWERTQAQLPSEHSTEVESLYRVICFPTAECIPDSPFAALSDVWRWGPRLGAELHPSQTAAFPRVIGAPTLLMAILNLTPDSFSDGGLHTGGGVAGAVAAAKYLHDAGADIIDIGGESTRPGSTALSAEEELQRILPVVDALHSQFPLMKLSVDTYHPSVAREAVRRGCVMINDVYGGTFTEASGKDGQESMLQVAAELNVPYVCMHMRGTVQTMTHSEHTAYQDVVRSDTQE
jgi:hypothetical protein